jgi:hypothetical protein
MLKARTLWVVASTRSATPGLTPSKSSMAIERCGRVLLGSGKDAQTAEHDARYRSRIRGGLDCGHLLAPVTVPSPSGEPCAAIATH